MTDQERLDDAIGGGVHYQDRERWAAPWRGMWQALCAWEQERHQRGDPIYPQELRREMHRIVDERPEAKAAFACRTTEYGMKAGTIG